MVSTRCICFFKPLGKALTRRSIRLRKSSTRFTR
jgi:hypothetical protein